MKTDKEKGIHKNRLEKERAKLLRSNKYICKDCGFIGKAKITKKGSWILFFIKWLIVLPLTIPIIITSITEVILRIITYSGIKSLIWFNACERIFPKAPYKLYACISCKQVNSMKKLNNHDGREIYERHEKECFIMRR